MGKHKSEDKKKKKGSQFVIRLDKDERDAFVALCDRLDTSAAREIRRFMRDWVATHSVLAPALDVAEVPAEPATEDQGGATPPPVADAIPDDSAAPVEKPKRKRKVTPA